MCVIIHQPKNAMFKPEFLENLYERNSDGFGIFFAENDQVHVHKIAHPSHSREVVALWEQYSNKPHIMHMRLTTHGVQDRENTHPYPVLTKKKQGKDLWVCHNGVLSISDPGHKRSDTWHFVKYILRPTLLAKPDLIFQTKYQEVLGKLIGNNKLALLDEDGSVAIINRDSGVDHHETGCWLSNTHNLQAPKSYHYSYGNIGKTAGMYRANQGNVSQSKIPIRSAISNISPSPKASTRSEINMPILEEEKVLAAALDILEGEYINTDQASQVSKSPINYSDLENIVKRAVNLVKRIRGKYGMSLRGLTPQEYRDMDYDDLIDLCIMDPATGADLIYSSLPYLVNEDNEAAEKEESEIEAQ